MTIRVRHKEPKVTPPIDLIVVETKNSAIMYFERVKSVTSVDVFRVTVDNPDKPKETPRKWKGYLWDGPALLELSKACLKAAADLKKYKE